MSIRYLDEIALSGKRVFIRFDFNVPMDMQGNITDDERIVKSLPSIRYALERGGMVIVASHLGRPQGKDKKLSLQPIGKRLSEYLGTNVIFASDTVGKEVELMSRELREGEILLLENLRFYPAEEKNDQDFSKSLAALCDIYINDAFSASHRAHASIVGITQWVKEKAGGFELKREMEFFKKLADNPSHPFVAIFGGSKVSDKLGLLQTLMDKRIDKILIGGGMAFTFLVALGYEVGKSIVEKAYIEGCREMLESAKARGIKVYLPVDFIVADKISLDAKAFTRPFQEIPQDWYALDIGRASTILFGEALSDARTIVWNGPMGVFELEPFSRGSFALASYMAGSHALTVAGGGDTHLVIKRAKEEEGIDYISSGGGAFLELLRDGTLPGIEALK